MIQDNNSENTDAQSRQVAVIASAIAVVKELADKYKPKEDSNWFEYFDKDGHRHTFEEDQGTYCEDCSETRKEEILNDAEIELPDDFEELYISTETSKENEDFLYCDSCGTIIECAIIWTDQEIEYWAELSNEDWINYKNSETSYYQIYKVLEETYGATEEYPDECLIISQKVLEHWL